MKRKDASSARSGRGIARYVDAGPPPRFLPWVAVALASCQFSLGPLEEADATTGGATSTSSDGTTTTTTATTATTATTTTSDVPNPACCAPQAEPGCLNAGIEACVCARDRFCCDSEWDAECVANVDIFGCGLCGTPGTGGNCCLPTYGLGCADADVSSCVCDLDPFCCVDAWDEVCADLVTDADCGECTAVEACCEASQRPSCGVPEIEACVCAARPECCSQSWDAACVAAVEILGCAGCPSTGGASCCGSHFDPGCETAEVQDCVCAVDIHCCEISWDEICVEEVDAFGCGPCDGFPGTSGGGSSSSTSGQPR